MASRLKRRVTGRAVILMYHRVADLAADPQLLGVTPRHFAEHLAVIRGGYRPMRLTELAAALRQGRLPRRAVVITMDDGYADNHHVARPLLERHEVPATIFVASGYVGSGIPFWWDELERLIIRPGTLPSSIELSLGRDRRRYDVEMIQYSAAHHERHRGWHVERPDDPTARHRLFRRLYDDLHDLSSDRRATALEELASVAAPDETADARRASFDRPLGADEITALAASPVVEIGAHSVTHAVLPLLTPDAQWQEIRDSRRQLEAIVQGPVTTFGYPHGRATPETARLVQQAGYICAGGSEAGTVTRHSELYQLPRMLVRDSDGDQLERQLRRWFDG